MSKTLAAEGRAAGGPLRLTGGRESRRDPGEWASGTEVQAEDRPLCSAAEKPLG